MNQFRSGAELPIGLGEMSGYSNEVGVESSPARSGAYSFYMHKTGFGGPHGILYRYFPEVSEVFIRFAWITDDVGTANNILSVRKGSTTIAAISLETTNRHFTIKVGSTVVDTGTFVYNNATWYLLELRLKIDDAAGALTLIVDGVVDADFAGDTKPGADTTVDNAYWTGVTSDHNRTNIDDIAINDTTGAVDNSWCGDGRVLYIPTNGAGDVTQLTPNTGANYAAVDEVPSDSDTTYVEGSNVDDYDLYNLAASGLAAGSEIKRVIPVATAKDTVANGGKIKVGLKTNGTEYFGDDITLTTSYTTALGTEYTVNPQTSAAWTIAELDALQAGVKVRGT